MQQIVNESFQTDITNTDFNLICKLNSTL